MCLVAKSGKVGIGTTSPGTYKLYVNGTLKVTGASALDDITCEDVSPRDVLSARNITASTGTFSSYIAANGGIKDDGGDYGTNGQVLSTNGSNAVHGVDQSGGGGSGDITSVIGGTGISVSGGTSDDATVNLDTAGSDSMVNALVELTTPHEDDFIIVSDEGTSGDPVKKCKLKHLEFVNNTTYSSSGCGFTINYRDWDNQTLDTVSITLSCGGGGS